MSLYLEQIYDSSNILDVKKEIEKRFKAKDPAIIIRSDSIKFFCKNIEEILSDSILLSSSLICREYSYRNTEYIYSSIDDYINVDINQLLYNKERQISSEFMGKNWLPYPKSVNF